MKHSAPYKALDVFLSDLSGDVLNIGDVNSSPHTIKMRESLNVTTISLSKGSDIVGDYNTIKLVEYDAVWCAHCLEHQRNVGAFLDKIHGELKEGGLLCITVPPLKHNIVGGHLSLWNAGLLLYNLILARFDCSQAHVIVDGYNISALLKKRTIKLPKLAYDIGDIELLADYFPFPVKHGFNGDIK